MTIRKNPFIRFPLAALLAVCITACGQDVAVVGSIQTTTGAPGPGDTPRDITRSEDRPTDILAAGDGGDMTFDGGQGSNTRVEPADVLDGCGDSLCASNETAQSCPADCDPGAAALSYCFAEKCVPELAACEDEEQCTKLLVCIATGEAASKCRNFSKLEGQNFSDTALALLKCGSLACYGYAGPPAGSCGDGVCSVGEKKQCQQDCDPPATPVCGDSFCQVATENRANCPEDCFDGKSFQSCFEQLCPGPAADCAILPGCIDSLKCSGACTSNVCAAKCVASISIA
ncbi:MAG: hypothetical protein CMH53_03085, partial [Myxococcales bacterium]|nr:hypothetical protein [Myxococcales bacterium]